MEPLPEGLVCGVCGLEKGSLGRRRGCVVVGFEVLGEKLEDGTEYVVAEGRE